MVPLVSMAVRPFIPLLILVFLIIPLDQQLTQKLSYLLVVVEADKILVVAVVLVNITMLHLFQLVLGPVQS